MVAILITERLSSFQSATYNKKLSFLSPIIKSVLSQVTLFEIKQKISKAYTEGQEKAQAGLKAQVRSQQQQKN